MCYVHGCVSQLRSVHGAQCATCTVCTAPIPLSTSSFVLPSVKNSDRIGDLTGLQYIYLNISGPELKCNPHTSDMQAYSMTDPAADTVPGLGIISCMQVPPWACTAARPHARTHQNKQKQHEDENEHTTLQPRAHPHQPRPHRRVTLALILGRGATPIQTTT